MVPVPAGSYRVGIDAPTSEAVSTRTVTIAAFSIDTFETTNADYLQFVEVVGAPLPRLWVRGRIPDGQEMQPVSGIDYEWAAAFCDTLGKRFPTDAEWEVAARGGDGRLYPWGNDPSVVDLESAGRKPVGAEARNVSPFGVHDTVGSAWEWIGTPYETAPAGQRVRRGGEYGRVRNGAAMRQVVDPHNASVIAETGFRCAANSVDPKLPRLKFRAEHALPAASVPGTTTVTATTPSGALVEDVFEDPKSGWLTRKTADYFVGYHAPGWYHVDASKPGTQVLSLLGVNYTDISIEAKVYVDKVNSQTRGFQYGLVFRATGPETDPPPGLLGPRRPEDFYAFVIHPRAKRWALLHADTLPMRQLVGGRLPVPVTVFDGEHPDTLRVEIAGTRMRFFVNGVRVGRGSTRGFHPQGDIGFYAETIDESRVHVHFDSVVVRRL